MCGYAHQLSIARNHIAEVRTVFFGIHIMWSAKPTMLTSVSLAVAFFSSMSRSIDTSLDGTYSAHYQHRPRSYTAPKCSCSSFIHRINGDISKPEWTTVPWSESFDEIRGAHDAPADMRPPLECRTRVKMMWDDTYLYIAALLESYNRTVVTSFSRRNEPIYQQDSDFEVFVDPSGSCHDYKELELNGYNTVWNLLLDKPYDDGGQEHSGRVAKDSSDKKYWEVYGQHTATKLLWGDWNDPNGAVWSVEMALAHSDTLSRYSPPLRRHYSPREGLRWRVNFSRVEEKGRINWTWSPQIVWEPRVRRYEGKVAMHLPDVWGYVTFAGPGDVDETSKLPSYDPTWPLRLAAMNVYYAQRYHREMDPNRRYASNMEELLPYVDEEILAPFEVLIEATDDGSGHRAKVVSRDTSNVVSVTDDRLLLVHSDDDTAINWKWGVEN